MADLLGHSSGLPAHRPYFLHRAGRAGYAAALAAEPLAYPPRSGHEYTDLGFILLGLLIEAAGAAPLATQFTAWREAALPGVALDFGPWRRAGAASRRPRPRPGAGASSPARCTTPTPRRSAGPPAMPGCSAPPRRVGAFARWFLRLWLGHVDAAAGVSAALAARFAARGEVPGSSRALGWDTMLPSSSCGRRLSPTAVGHTGFTGTSLWIDPVRDLYVVLLTNRVHPVAAAADGIQALRVAVHDAVAEGWPR